MPLCSWDPRLGELNLSNTSSDLCPGSMFLRHGPSMPISLSSLVFSFSWSYNSFVESSISVLDTFCIAAFSMFKNLFWNKVSVPSSPLLIALKGGKIDWCKILFLAQYTCRNITFLFAETFAERTKASTLLLVFCLLVLRYCEKPEFESDREPVIWRHWHSIIYS